METSQKRIGVSLRHLLHIHGNITEEDWSQFTSFTAYSWQHHKRGLGSVYVIYCIFMETSQKRIGVSLRRLLHIHGNITEEDWSQFTSFTAYSWKHHRRGLESVYVINCIFMETSQKRIGVSLRHLLHIHGNITEEDWSQFTSFTAYSWKHHR